jgi:hypothetical protein
MNVVYIIYLLTAGLISFGGVFFTMQWFDLVYWAKTGIIIFLGGLIFSLFVASMEGLLGVILTSEFKLRNDFYPPKWKSKEFDSFVGDELIELYQDSTAIMKDYKNHKDFADLHILSDYSFVVLPIAKVYEGILKKILVEKGLVSEEEMASSPDLNVSAYFNPVGNAKIFTHLSDRARDKAIPHVIYSTYQECRNQILHYDQYRDNRIESMEDAVFYHRRILHAIDKAYETFRK